MGNEQSADFQSSNSDPQTQSKGLFRRSSTLPSKLKAPKLKYLSDFQYAASYLALRVQNFTGIRHDQQYDEIEKQIVDVSMELQKYRSTLLRDADRIAADGLQKNISDCLAALLRKAQENENAAIENVTVLPSEENSFVEQRTESSFQSQQSLQEPQKKKEHRKSKNRQSVPPKYQKRMQTLQQIEKVVLELKAGVTNAIFCQQSDSFYKYESKIKTICRDLELVDVEDHSPLSDKKKELYDLLIKCNNNIKKARRRMERQVAVDVPDYVLATSEMDNLEEEIHRTEALIQNENENYEVLKFKFEQLAEKVAAVRNHSELQDRKKIAAEVITSNLSKIYFLEIQKKLNNFNTQIKEFRYVKNSDEFVELDQQLRQLWHEVAAIEGSEERKFRMIAEIRNAIQTLLRKAESNDKTIEKRKTRSVEKIQRTSQEIPVFQTNEISHQKKEIQKQQAEVSETVPPLSEESAKQKNLEEIIDDFVQQWHGLKLHTEANKWKNVEKARIKIKLANMVSNIQDILEVMEEQNDNVYEEISNKQEEGKPIYFKPVLLVKPETSKVLKETASLDGLKKTEQKQETGTATKRDSTAERLTELQVAVEGLKQKVANFNEAIRNIEYERIKNSIQHCVSELKPLQPKSKNLIEQVYDLAEELEIKVAENQTKSISTRTKLKEVVEKLQSIKKRIDAFSGTYGNVLYKKIEDDLKSTIDTLGSLNCYGDKKLLFVASQTKQKAQQYLKILENKSAKPDDVQETLIQKRASAIPFESIQKVRVKLMDIKSRAENFNGFNDDSNYKLLQKELSSCARELTEIDDYGRSSIQESKQQYLNYIDEMLKYLEQKAEKRKSEEYVITPIVTEKSDPKKQLQQIEENFAALVQKIEAFNGKSNDKLYAYLDEMLILTLIALDALNAKDDMLDRKNYLTSKVHQYSKLLAEKAKAKKLEEGQYDLDTIRAICSIIKFEIDCRSEIDDQAYNEFNERLVNLLLKIDGLRNEEEKAKIACREHISEVLRTLQNKINYKIKFVADLDGIQI